METALAGRRPSFLTQRRLREQSRKADMVRAKKPASLPPMKSLYLTFAAFENFATWRQMVRMPRLRIGRLANVPYRAFGISRFRVPAFRG